MEKVVELKNFSFSYENKKIIFKNAELSISKGEKICILGKNGTGKSTLLKIVSGILKITGGEYYLLNKKIDYSKKSISFLRKHVGIVFQNPDIQLLSTTVEQDISFGLFNLGYDKETVKEKLNKVLKELEIEKLKDEYTQKLSYGQKRKVAIAGVLAMEPEIILLDEPFSFLDVDGAKEVYKLLLSLNQKGKTIVVVTHNTNFAKSFADKIYIVENGKISDCDNLFLIENSFTEFN